MLPDFPAFFYAIYLIGELIMAALKSQGSGFWLSDGASPEVYTEVPDVTSVTGPDGTSTEIDVTALDSTAKEFLVGLPDSGNITVEMIWGGEPSPQTNQNLLRTAWTSQSLQSGQVRLSDSPQTKYQFSFYVMGWSLSGLEPDGAARATVTCRITGAVTVVA
jgi:hypothetical protein